MERIGDRPATGSPSERGERAAVPRHDRPRRRGRGRRLRLLRDPRRPARGPRGRRGGPARRSACSGRRRPAPAASASRCARSRRWSTSPRPVEQRAPQRLADQLHQPRRDGHRGRAAGARRPRGRHLRLAVAACAAASPARSAAPRADVVRLLRPQPPRLAARARTTPSATACPELLADDDALGALRGGPAVRRRLAALARDDPERVPLLLLSRTRWRDGREPARRLPARVSRRAFYAQNGQDPAAALEAWRATRAERDRTYMAAERAAPPASRPTTTTATTAAATRARRWRSSRRSPTTRGAIMILNTANRSALPFLDERAVVEVPVHRRAAPARCRSRSAPSPRTPRRS